MICESEDVLIEDIDRIEVICGPGVALRVVTALANRLHGTQRKAPTQRVEPRVARFDGARILLAEDYPVNREIATAKTHAMGCHVTQAHNGAQALVEVRQQRFDLVLMDCQMPNMDGFEATRRIRAWEQAQGPSELRYPVRAWFFRFRPALAGDCAAPRAA